MPSDRVHKSSRSLAKSRRKEKSVNLKMGMVDVYGRDDNSKQCLVLQACIPGTSWVTGDGVPSLPSSPAFN